MASLLAQLKHWIKVKKGIASAIKVETSRKKKWYGTSYGGFYVDPTLLNSKPIVYSFGIGQDISFDKEMIAKHQAEVFGFDPTPKSIAWIAKEPVSASFHFHPIGIGVQTGTVKFNLPKNKEHVSGSIHAHDLVDEEDSVDVYLKSFVDIVQEFGHDHIDVLKMDIEGSEFSVIEHVLMSGIHIKQILVEVHENFFDDGQQKGDKFFTQMRKSGYAIFGISDTYQEVSFVKL